MKSRICVVCSNDYQPITGNQKACTDCRGKYIIQKDIERYKADLTRTCIECGVKFTAEHGTVKICSDKCRTERTTRKAKEYRDAHKEKINQRAKELYWLSREDRLTKSKARKTPEKKEELNKKARVRYAERERVSRHMRIYKVSFDEAVSLLNETRCAICKAEVKLHTDHCHDTGVVRGRLCTQCNNGLGRFRDDINLLDRAIGYLKRSKYEAKPQKTDDPGGC